VGDDHDRGPGGVQLAQQTEYGLPGSGVQVAGRLVRQQDRRFADHRPGHRHPLALTAGQLVREVVDAVAEADPFQRRRRPGPATT
jgi:hypothetical protein